jgi:hypothetical protein
MDKAGMKKAEELLSKGVSVFKSVKHALTSNGHDHHKKEIDLLKEKYENEKERQRLEEENLRLQHENQQHYASMNAHGLEHGAWLHGGSHHNAVHVLHHEVPSHHSVGPGHVPYHVGPIPHSAGPVPVPYHQVPAPVPYPGGAGHHYAPPSGGLHGSHFPFPAFHTVSIASQNPPSCWLSTFCTCVNA